MASAMLSRPVVAFFAVTLVAGTAVAALSLKPVAKQVKFDLDAKAHRRVQPAELADWIVTGKRDFAVVDLRGDEAFEAGHVKDAVHCGSCHESRKEGRQAAEEHFIDLSKKLVLYTQTGKERVELPRLLARNPRLYVLDGGYDRWQRDVLAPVTLGGELDPAEAEAHKRREAVRAFFSGERPGQTAQPARLPVTPIRRDSAHQPAAAHEGC